MPRSTAYLLLAASLTIACARDDDGAGAKGEDAGEAKPASASAGPVINHEVETIDGKTVSLADYRGKTLLIVNTASECGFTPQYAELQQLYATYKDRGLEVLAFPSNDYGGQEPGTNADIAAFVNTEYDVAFPMFAKLETSGDAKAPLYQALTEQTPTEFAGDIKWNFTKFLVTPDGHVAARFESAVSPMSEELTTTVEEHLPG